jgi:hypothetical protein
VSKETEFRQRAEECVKLAQMVRTSEERTMLLHIAETWLRLADHSVRGNEAGPNQAPA